MFIALRKETPVTRRIMFNVTMLNLMKGRATKVLNGVSFLGVIGANIIQ